ncbi:MAG: hypothetical protein R2715_24090, partial [Ilumatobacteraceae bacterium]
WKHVGVVDFLIRTGGLDRFADQLAVYHQWPGFFSAAGTITSLVGSRHAVMVAMLAPLFFNFANLVLLHFVISTFTSDRRVKWLALSLFFVTNWIGQDYFSPQAFAFVMHLAVIALVLQRYSLEDRNHIGRTWSPIWSSVVICLLILGISVSHQITPVMLTSSLLLLALTRRAAVWPFFFFSAAANVAWGSTWARPFISDQIGKIVDRAGDVTGNAAGTFRDTSVQSSGQALVSTMGRMTFAVIGILAVIGFLRRWRQGNRDWTAGILAGAPAFALLNNYGVEVVFRVVLFSLPMLSLFAARALAPGMARPWKPLRTLVTVGAVGVLVTGYLFGYYGKERQYYFTPDEREAMVYLQDTAPDHTLLITLTTNYPNLIDRYERFLTVPITNQRADSLNRILDAPVDTMSRWLDNSDYDATYLLISQAQLNEITDVGDVPVERTLDFVRAIESSPRFEPVFQSPAATIYRLTQTEEPS